VFSLQQQQTYSDRDKFNACAYYDSSYCCTFSYKPIGSAICQHCTNTCSIGIQGAFLSSDAIPRGNRQANNGSDCGSNRCSDNGSDCSSDRDSDPKASRNACTKY
jgi:hypothetical protein